MNKYLLITVCALLPLVSLAYTPTPEDKDWLRMVDNQFEDLFPAHADQLVRIYDDLDSKKVQMRIMDGERGLYLWGKMKRELHHQLFRQSDVCIPTHAQRGDTVELQYKIHNLQGDLIRATSKPLAFNPGKNQVWYSLEATVLGMQLAETLYRPLKTTGVIPSADGTEHRTVARSKLDTSLSLVVGNEYSFGSLDYDRVVIGTISAIENDMVTFDFVDANNEDQVYITVSLDRLRKACSK